MKFGIHAGLMSALTLGSLLLSAMPAQAERAVAQLSSFRSVPVTVAKGEGTLILRTLPSQGRIQYRLSYEGVDSNILQSHIHLGNAWETGGVISFLCTNLGNAPSAAVPACPQQEGSVSGVIAAADVLGPGGDKGLQPGDIEALFGAIESGAVYVNLHTEAIPSGHIRGQLR